MAISIAKMLGAEFLGTYLLVLTLGCGAATDAGVLAVLSVAAVLMVPRGLSNSLAAAWKRGIGQT